MSKRLLSSDPVTGIQRFFHWDDDTDDFLIQTVQDCEPIAEVNKAQFNEFSTTSRWNDGMTKVASIPLSVYFDLQKKGIADDPAAMRRWLNSSDNAVFRTRPGRV
jgi:hypothetical protein